MPPRPLTDAQKASKLRAFRRYVRTRGGTTKLKEFRGNHVREVVFCKGKKHRFLLSFYHAQERNYWCDKCARVSRARKLRKYDIEDMQRFAEERGGRCRSKVFISVSKSLDWECADGHKWSAKFSNLQRGGWCPDCRETIGESICRIYLEGIFGKEFKKVRPPWLINRKTNRPLELDGYNEKLRIAFEHQGIQHFIYDPRRVSKEEFAEIKRKDRLKVRKCAKAKVKLIVVRQVPSHTRLLDLPNFMLSEFRRLRIRIPRNFKAIEVPPPSTVRIGHVGKLKKLQIIAKSHEGRCTSKKYSGSDVRHSFVCKKRHRWKTWPHVILRGSWCQKCGGDIISEKNRMPISEMRKIGNDQGVTLVSTEAKGYREVYQWQCKRVRQHKFPATFNSIQAVPGCRICPEFQFGDTEWRLIELIKKGGGGTVLLGVKEIARKLGSDPKHVNKLILKMERKKVLSDEKVRNPKNGKFVKRRLRLLRKDLRRPLD